MDLQAQLYRAQEQDKSQQDGGAAQRAGARSGSKVGVLAAALASAEERSAAG
jgi:hypothetical protein